MENEVHNLKIAFLTAFDPQDRRSWSGVFYYIAQVLQKHCGEVFYIGPINVRKQMVGKVLNKGSQFLIKKKFPYYISFSLARSYAKTAAQLLARGSFDLIVAPAGATITAFLETDVPIVLVEDATFALLHDYHAEFSNLLERSVCEANTIMDLALKRASLLLFSSAWAAQSAIEDYHADRHKVHVIPFGANLESPPSRDILETRKKSDRCRLLFVGLNWRRKGGEIAFETLVQLEKLGIQAELIVCGCTPPKRFSHPRMTVIPFLDKNDKQQYMRLEELYLAADFLLLPTRYDSSPIVICEANAFGLPVITANTGGVSEMVRDGENGFVLPYEAGGSEYAHVLAQIYRDEQRYADLVRSSRAAFEARLNWDAWGTHVKHLLAQLLGPKNACLTTYQPEKNMLKQEQTGVLDC